MATGIGGEGAVRIGKHFNNLTPAEAERLALLSEECGEIVQVIGKIFRHGYESCHPDDQQGITNRKLLEKETGDAIAAIAMLIKAGDISEQEIEHHAEEKKENVVKYLHHQ
jgi:NTP pyrophosphatase (non-canonical NTP hydrolase)